MDRILKKLKDASSDCCVTLIFTTHRTFPDRENDVILLKNMVGEALARLERECSPEASRALADRLKNLASSIDHQYNQESLMLFVNQHVAEYVKLPVKVEDRIVIGKAFATRDLIRALHKEKDYFLLVLGRDKARLIEAFNDKVVQEIEGDFPVENVSQFPSERSEAAIASRQTSLIQEFFNRVDKQLMEVVKENPLPVVICTEESNYHQYLKIADRKEVIVGHLPGSRVGAKAHEIVDAAWPILQRVRGENNRKRLEELTSAESAGRVITDLSEIWRAVNRGRGQTLFIQQGYFQPARLVDDTVELVSAEEANRTGVVDDLIDKMITINSQQGGDSVFLPPQDLQQYQGVALVTRY